MYRRNKPADLAIARPAPAPETDALLEFSRTVLSLPMHPNLDAGSIARVAQVMTRFAWDVVNV